jgi:hypothetical protein
MYTLRLLAGIGLMLLVLPFCVSPEFAAQAPGPPTTRTESAYIAAFRTPAHVNRSSPEVFHGAVDGVLDLLKSKHVVLASDPSRPMIQTQETIPQETLLNLTKDAGANYPLVVTVDRPLGSWLKVTIQCFDSSGKSLWEEHASYTEGMTGKKAVQKVMEKLGRQLEPRLAQPGLPVAKGDSSTKD